MLDLSSIDFKDIYITDEASALQPDRYANAVSEFNKAFEGTEPAAVFSAPGRTEIGGNHTDHQHGEVLAASINKDAIAVVSPRDDKMVNVLAEGFGMTNIDLNDLSLREDEKGTTPALIRGVLAGLKDNGFILGGFDAYITSDVLIGAGLSSSAAFETLIGTIVSGLYNDSKIDPVTIAKIGQFAENRYFGKPCGLMDQMACSVGNLVHIDFNDTDNPVVDKVDFDFSKTDYVLCITDTKGSHADLTNEYAAVPLEMKKIASLLGYEVLRPISFEDIIDNIDMLRDKAGDRAVLRAIHFVNETLRAQDEAESLKSGDLKEFLSLVKQSGDSSFKYLQNVYTNSDVTVQNVSLALAISDTVLNPDEVSRVHGGGFAGTIQAFVKKGNAKRYKKYMDKVFGDGSCGILAVRKYGGIRVI
ncbi:galactokinase [Ruminococcaceae bacterium R-25]|nr:galactokinase [Ruminococcaceae bacterium R-25]SUQ10759.1 galactokinase [Oscillospiraceae bacterium]